MSAKRLLLLLRHAKSSWDDETLTDFERPLSPRGRKAAPRMGGAFAERGWRPDRVLVSTAARARETWALLAPALAAEPAVAELDALYLAPPERLLALAKAAPDSVSTLLAIGHNPGMHEAACLLAGPRSDRGALGRLKAKFPTGAVAALEFTGSWRDLAFGHAMLVGFVRPKDMG